MCRLFGFRSVLESQVHSSLLSAENALAMQSAEHPHGWGVSYYLEGAPHLVKSGETALTDQLFKKVSGVVSSQTLLAHVRKATQGGRGVLNTHPFQFGPWTFAHNGHIKDFFYLKKDLLRQVDKSLGRFVLGETDSEVLFFILLSQLKKSGVSLGEPIAAEKLLGELIRSVHGLVEQIGPLTQEPREDPKGENYLTFLLTNGKTFSGFQAGQPLFYSTHKKKCPERATCPLLTKSCESKATDQNRVRHLLFSSERLIGDNVWYPLPFGQALAVDESMKLKWANL